MADDIPRHPSMDGQHRTVRPANQRVRGAAQTQSISAGSSFGARDQNVHRLLFHVAQDTLIGDTEVQ